MRPSKFRSFLLLGLLAGFIFSGCDTPTDPDDQVSTPVFNPAGGTFEGMIEVGITTATLGTTIQYTTDGSVPNSGSPVYSEPVFIYTTTTLKAKASRSGLKDSDTASATYTITTAPIPENFVAVEGGTFNNGTSDVTISSFYIDKYELTQTGYQAVMGTNPSEYSSVSNGPVERVSWFNAIEYCNRRSLQEGLTLCYSYSSFGTNPTNWPSGWNTNHENHTNISCNWTANGYRLPTEMEWMYAAKGANQSQNYTYSGSNTIGEVAWYSSNSGNTTHSVGTKAANELGTFDMSGNVLEWVWDIYEDYPSGSQTNPTGASSGTTRVRRGGCWISNANFCTVSYRSHLSATGTADTVGFRCVRVSP